MTAAGRTVVKDEADLGQTKRMTRKRHDRAVEAGTGKLQARERHDRIMPKKDMAENVKEGQVCMIVAQGMS